MQNKSCSRKQSIVKNRDIYKSIYVNSNGHILTRVNQNVVVVT
jgi:hypothetical protein